jgi:hypothetical protein
VVFLLFSTILAGPSPMPAYHGNGLDELVCLVLPLVILGVAMLIIMRRQPGLEDEDETDQPEAGDEP